MPGWRALCKAAVAALALFATVVPPVDAAQAVNITTERVAQATAARYKAMTANQRRAAFDEWKVANNKTYANATASSRAFKNWNANADAMVAHNQRSGNRHFLGVGPYADLTAQEFGSTVLMPSPNQTYLDQLRAPLLNDSYLDEYVNRALPPLAVDWRTRVALPPIRNQGACQCCWAFAGTAAIEIWAVIKGRYAVPDLAEQQLVDCANAAHGQSSNGCNGGGYPEDVYLYAAKYIIRTEARWPYLNADRGWCPQDAGWNSAAEIGRAHV